MRVGILTFHGSVNPGAFWQAFSTCQLLQRLGHTPVVLDYRYPRRHPRSAWSWLMHARSYLHPFWTSIAVGQRLLATRSRTCLPLSLPLLGNEDIAGQRCDAIIIGSDVVWEAPADPVYWGIGIGKAPLIAYAASAGSTPADAYEFPFAEQTSSPFAAISVRDENTRRLIERAGWAGGLRSVSDPTLTLNVPESCLQRPAKRPYLLIYCSSRPPRDMVEATRRYARDRGLKTVAVFYPQRWADINVPLLTAHRWMAYIANAECAVTNTFHGAVLSCLRDRPLAVVNLGDKTARKTAAQYAALGIDQRIALCASDLPAMLDEPWPAECREQRTALADVNRAFLQESLGSTRTPTEGGGSA